MCNSHIITVRNVPTYRKKQHKWHKVKMQSTNKTFQNQLKWYLLSLTAKHKMTGGAERVAHIYSPPPLASVPRLKHTSWYMSYHYICLQFLFFLSLIFRLCWLWRNRELVWDIVRGKFAKQLLSVFFLPNEVISYVYKGQSICSVLVNMQHHEVVQSRVSRCWAQIRLHPL